VTQKTKTNKKKIECIVTSWQLMCVWQNKAKMYSKTLAFNVLFDMNLMPDILENPLMKINLRNKKRDRHIDHDEYWQKMEFISKHLGIIVESLTSAKEVRHSNCWK
jgi:hypothetical protein